MICWKNSMLTLVLHKSVLKAIGDCVQAIQAAVLLKLGSWWITIGESPAGESPAGDVGIIGNIFI